MQTSMRILSNVKSKIFALILGALLWVTSGYALEISDLALPMNRDKADDTLSKDYMYKVLGDGSIRTCSPCSEYRKGIYGFCRR